MLAVAYVWELDKAVMQMSVRVRAAKMVTTRATLQSFDRRAAPKLHEKGQSGQARKWFREFSTADGRVSKFVRRNEFDRKTLHGQAGSVDANAVAQGMAKVRAACADDDPESIFNVDETGLFFWLSPCKT